MVSEVSIAPSFANFIFPGKIAPQIAGKLNFSMGALKLWVGEYGFVEGYLLLHVERSHLSNKVNQEHWSWEGRTSIRDTTWGAQYGNDFLCTNSGFPSQMSQELPFYKLWPKYQKYDQKYPEQCRIQRYITLLSCLYHFQSTGGIFVYVNSITMRFWIWIFYHCIPKEWIRGGRGLLNLLFMTPTFHNHFQIALLGSPESNGMSTVCVLSFSCFQQSVHLVNVSYMPGTVF